MNLQDGDIVLTHANSFSTWYRWLFSHLIRIVDGCYYNHAQLFFAGQLHEADLKVRVRDISENDGDNILVLRPSVELTSEEKIKLREFLAEEFDKPYGFIAVIVWQLINVITFRRVWLGHTGAQADKKPYCTEFVSRAYNKLRGYFPEYYKTSPTGVMKLAPFYFYTVFEGKQLKQP